MTQHNLFYYPYASFSGSQSLLLKAAALYFDKLYILDPLKASFGQIRRAGDGCAEPANRQNRLDNFSGRSRLNY